MRRALRQLKKSGKVESKRYRKLYLQVKGGRFSSVRELLDQVTPSRKTARRTKR
jgi:ribosomal protein L19E